MPDRDGTPNRGGPHPRAERRHPGGEAAAERQGLPVPARPPGRHRAGRRTRRPVFLSPPQVPESAKSARTRACAVTEQEGEPERRDGDLRDRAVSRGPYPQ
ncbi:hypothetical protein EASAB2608_01312 [Streptomyces sp. EAS-AB2608]|uniref:Uncharacterized protein n=1 Tax=Streptomyces bangladeshensis TaxID=295352 RepID=A0ABP5P0P5_9ACTN|nr:hypothetical protein EASAB2608_01312 [Streptomyces sp. EAS-AB2608]